MAVSGLILAAAMLAMDPDGVVVTAPATTVDLEATAQPVTGSIEGAAQAAVPHGLSTDQQIDRWIAARSTADQPWTGATEPSSDDGKVHGEVSLGIGTDGWRDYGVAVSVPIGEHTRLDLQYRHVENGPPYAYYGSGLDNRYYDDSGYAFPGYQPAGAAAEFESRLMRPGGPPRRFPLIQPNRADGD